MIRCTDGTRTRCGSVSHAHGCGRACSGGCGGGGDWFHVFLYFSRSLSLSLSLLPTSLSLSPSLTHSRSLLRYPLPTLARSLAHLWRSRVPSQCAPPVSPCNAAASPLIPPQRSTTAHVTARKNHDAAADAPYARDDQRFGNSELRQVGPSRLLRTAGMRPDVYGELAQNDKLRVHVYVCALTYSGRKNEPSQSRCTRCDNWLNVLNKTWSVR